MQVAVKVGPWGASIGQQHHDIPNGSNPQALVSIKICSSKLPGGQRHILGFAFVYVDQNGGDPIPVGPWGVIDPEQNIMEIEMGPGEYLYKLSGIASDTTLYSLRLITNRRTVYSAGYPEVPVAQSFSVPLGNRKVVAFFGRSDETLKALGIYVPVMQGSPIKVGPLGGSGAVPVDITTPVQLKSVTVYSSEYGDGRIYGFSFTYIDLNGQAIQVGPWGTVNGQEHRFDLNPGEYVNNISGTFGDGGVTSLKFTTNQNPEGYGPFGFEAGFAFSVPLPNDRDDNGGAVAGFFGRSGERLVALGVYVSPKPKP